MAKSSINDIEKLLQPYVSLVSKYGADGKSLARIESLLYMLGNPQQKLKVIHIAGTSGKTSTAYYVAHLLSNSGYKVGLSVSPHVYSLSERTQILDKSFTEDDFITELNNFLKILEEIEVKPSYFELFTAFSLWVFDKQEVDFVVLETGMGGLLDASNITKREDKICVITDIGYDHMRVLGNSIEQIAYQKAGIVHKNNKLFMYEQSKEVMEVVKSRVKESHAILNIVKEIAYNTKIATESQLSEYQYRNYILAKKVHEYCLKMDNKSSNTKINAKHVKIPARMEILKLKDRSTLILDGAHNVQKMEAFIKSIKLSYPNSSPNILIALKNEKDYEKIIDTLIPITSEIIVTNFVSSKKLPSLSIDPEKLKKYIEENYRNNVIAFTDPEEATEHLLNSKSNLKIITGSFYLISQVRSTIISSL